MKEGGRKNVKSVEMGNSKKGCERHGKELNINLLTYE